MAVKVGIFLVLCVSWVSAEADYTLYHRRTAPSTSPLIYRHEVVSPTPSPALSSSSDDDLTPVPYSSIHNTVVEDRYRDTVGQSFDYMVHDSITGDIKAQYETRVGDVVRGYYTLNDADGTRRIVHYTADPKNGFLARVRHIGTARYPMPGGKQLRPHIVRDISRYRQRY